MPTRRQVLRGSVALGAGAALGAPLLLHRHPATASGHTVRVTPFAVPLPVPPEARSTVGADGIWRSRIVIAETDLQLLPEGEGGPTRLWTYGGSFPGVTLRSRRGTRHEVTYVNQLSASTTIHLHGGNVPASEDGHPADLIAPGRERTYRYPITQRAATLWYHDHSHGRTAEMVHAGLAGLHLIEDPALTVALPSGTHDLPLVLTDRSFGPDGQLVYDGRGHMGALGRTHLVNGAPHPVLTADPTRYRFRILNACNARRYELAFDDGRPMTLVGSDGGLVEKPVTVTRVGLSPAERVEVVVDLSDLAVGATIHLRDLLDEVPGTADETRLLRIEAGSAAPSSAAVPGELSTIPALGAPVRTRDLILGFRDGVWVIDGLGFDHHRIDQYPRLGTVERWRLHNPTPLTHPIHLHLVMFQVVERDGVAVAPAERGWRDTVPVFPNEVVTLAARFGDHPGRFVYHCHNLEHEDHDMMAQMRVVDLPRLAGASRIETAVEVSRRRPAAVARAYLATAGDFPDALAAGPAAVRDGGPVLLTAADELPDAVRAELVRLRPTQIVVVGGPRVVSDAVLAEANGLATSGARRVAGESRFATAVALSQLHHAAGSTDTVVVVSGRGFPDAVSGGSLAADLGAPVLLTERDTLPSATAAELDRLRPARVLIVGGTAVVSATVADAIAARGPAVTRLAGPDRFATTAAAGTFERDRVRELWVATGDRFPDALAGVAGAGGAPVLLTSRDRLPDPVRAAITTLRPARIVVLGGRAAIGDAVEDALATLLPDTVTVDGYAT